MLRSIKQQAFSWLTEYSVWEGLMDENYTTRAKMTSFLLMSNILNLKSDYVCQQNLREFKNWGKARFCGRYHVYVTASEILSFDTSECNDTRTKIIVSWSNSKSERLLYENLNWSIVCMVWFPDFYSINEVKRKCEYFRWSHLYFVNLMVKKQNIKHGKRSDIDKPLWRHSLGDEISV